MAIWRRARDIKRSERSVRTRAILDDDGFLECHTERLGDDTANRIAAAAGAEHGNEGDRLAGIVVGEKRRAEQCRPCGHENEAQFFHAWFLSGCREFLCADASLSRRRAPYQSVRSSIADPGNRCLSVTWGRLSQRPVVRRKNEHLSLFTASARCRGPWRRQRSARAGARYRQRSRQ